MKKLVCSLVVMSLLAGLFVACAQAPKSTPSAPSIPSPSPTPTPKAEPIELKAISFLPKTDVNHWGANKFVEMVNERSKGELRINYVGGPEVMSTAAMLEAVKSGSIDINFSAATYAEPLVPQAATLPLSRITPQQERKPGGFYDYMVESSKAVGVYYLGRSALNIGFYVMLNNPVKKPQDLAGLKIRSTGLCDPLFKSLGAVPVAVAFPDIYTSLERSLVVGHAWAVFGVVDYGWATVLKYLIDHPLFYAHSQLTLMNLNRWNKLPKNLQDLLINISAELEGIAGEEYKKLEAAEKQKMAKAGMQSIQFSADDAKYYVNLAYESYWADLTKRYQDWPAKVRAMIEPQ